MPEYRHDPLSDRWVIVAPNRLGRPNQFNRAPLQSRAVAPCPFCAGHEDETPPEISTYSSQADAAAPWQVRVIPNKYPAVCSPVGNVSLRGDGEIMPGLGSHEVIIESPDHVTSFSELSDEQSELTFLAYRDRFRALKAVPNLAHAQIFKNARADGGASLEHSHSQLIATSMVPVELQRQFARAGEHRLAHRCCIFCELVARTLDDGLRLVADTERFVAVTPFASRFPYETWVLPRAHREFFEETEPAAIAELAHFVRELVRRIEWLLDKPAYNYWIHTAPFKPSRHDDYHWHLELVPRLTRMAGFELGAGCFINPVSPEDAARRLRTACLDNRSRE